MFGFLKNIVRKLAETSEDREQTYTQEDYNASAPEQQSRPVNPRQRNGGSNGGSASQAYGAAQRVAGLDLPLQPILASLPLELQPRIFQSETGDLAISVPLE